MARPQRVEFVLRFTGHRLNYYFTLGFLLYVASSLQTTPAGKRVSLLFLISLLFYRRANLPIQFHLCLPTDSSYYFLLENTNPNRSTQEDSFIKIPIHEKWFKQFVPLSCVPCVWPLLFCDINFSFLH